MTQPAREPTYYIGWNGAAGLFIWCLRCSRLSYHPADVEHRYCGACHRYHEGAGL